MGRYHRHHHRRDYDCGRRDFRDYDYGRRDFRDYDYGRRGFRGLCFPYSTVLDYGPGTDGFNGLVIGCRRFKCHSRAWDNVR
jgi:hypothetical protein